MKPVDLGGCAFKGLGGIGSRHSYVIIRHIRIGGGFIAISGAAYNPPVGLYPYYARRGYKCKSFGPKGVDYANWETKVERDSIL